MGNISVSLPSDGETIDASDYNTPINTIVNVINGDLDNSNIASDAAIAGSKLANGSVTAEKTAFGGNFTTSEVDTGFTWVDGKTIYKKTVSLGSLPNNTTKDVAHGITGYDNFISIGGWAKTGTITLPLPYVNPTSNQSIAVILNGDNIQISAAVDRAAFTGYVTIFYTKT